mgnify:CR=1 FL=1
MVLLIVVKMLIEILPQFHGNTFWIVLGDVLMINHLQCSAFGVIFIVEMIDCLGHLLFRTAAVGEAKATFFSAIGLSDVLQSIEKRVFLVTTQTRNEIAAL